MEAAGKLYWPHMQASPPPRNSSAPQTNGRTKGVLGTLFFAGLVAALAVAAAVLVRPSLVDDLAPYWPPLALLCLIATLGGFSWLWWRPR